VTDDRPSPLRADARRNRARVLQAAQEAFTAEGLSVPLDEIARRAGVGPGTVYRHFPTKEALFEAVVVHRIEEMAEDARACLASDEHPGEAFFAFFSRFVDQAVLNRALNDAFGTGAGALPSAVTETKHEVMALFGELLTRAQQAGEVRGDIGVADLGALVLGCLAMERRALGGGPPGRLVAIVRDGLRADRRPFRRRAQPR
jgi:AcrR family transcriptional regulator